MFTDTEILDFGNVVNLKDYKEPNWKDFVNSTIPFFQISHGKTSCECWLWEENGEFHFNWKHVGLDEGMIFSEKHIVRIERDEHYGTFFYFVFDDNINTKDDDCVYCARVHITDLDLNQSAINKFLYTSNPAFLV